jgi:hypothetical protein
MIGVEGGLEDQFNVHIIGLYDAKKSHEVCRKIYSSGSGRTAAVIYRCFVFESVCAAGFGDVVKTARLKIHLHQCVGMFFFWRKLQLDKSMEPRSFLSIYTVIVLYSMRLVLCSEPDESSPHPP